MARPLPVHKHSGFERTTPGVRTVDIRREYSAVGVKVKNFELSLYNGLKHVRRFSQYLIPP